ncbi:hypothetical protein BLNAU_17076 [Blattamonas nauphoetae]|uniref:Uncharacterized protein n=1 Tax=Blattamonas nauphoetae TaxID=2049346 RepID=A0ABQ9XBC4_9EUKA|nr:hypothetical protein BLNAU_17076 [Blattamonas nauphoetae]
MTAPLVAVTPLLFAERSKSCISIVNRNRGVTATDESVWAETCDNNSDIPDEARSGVMTFEKQVEPNWTDETATVVSEMNEEVVFTSINPPKTMILTLLESHSPALQNEPSPSQPKHCPHSQVSSQTPSAQTLLRELEN